MKPPSDDTPEQSGTRAAPRGEASDHAASAELTAGEAAGGDGDRPTAAPASAAPLNEIEAFRAQELLLLRATEGLSDAQLAELAALGDAADDDSYDLAAAAVDLATLPRYELPSDVAQRLLLAAGVRPPRAASDLPTRQLGRAATAPSAEPRASSPPLQLPILPADRPATPFSASGPRAPSSSGASSSSSASSSSPIVARPSRAPLVAAWTVAALAVAAAAALVLWTMRQPAKTIVQRVEVPVPAPVPVPPRPPTPAEARQALLASAPDVETLPWSLTADPAARGASGDVVWSASRQEGYMRFVGLAPNDPKVLQYQLWIFDKLRDERYPVDGGVFDVGAIGPDGELVIKITAKLAVGEPVLFAVTVEPPGGVVVSKRERIVVTAAPKKTG